MLSVFAILPLLLGWFLDLLIGDPAWLPHPVVGFGKMIAFGDKLSEPLFWGDGVPFA